MVTLVNRAKVATSTTGTGAVSLGAAEDGYQTFSDAGLTGSETIRYTIEDGDAWEIGTGGINGSATTMSRTLIESSTGSKLNLSGNAVVYVTAAGQDIQQPPSEGPFVDGDKTKLDGIEAGADVTDTTNVTDAGALMDSEVTNLAQVKAFDSSDYATAAQGTLADSALQSGDNVSALTNDAGYTTNVGDITGVTAGTGLSGGGASGSVTLNVDLSELTDMTGGMVGSDEFIVLDAGADRRKAASEIGLSIFNNDAGFTTNVGDITGVTAGSGISGGGTSGTVTINHADTSSQGSVNNSGATFVQDVTVDTYGHVTGLGSATISPATIGAATSAQGSLADSALQSGDNISALTNDAGYTTNVGDITNVSAGGGLTGGGSSGSVTVSHSDTSSQGSVNNSGGTVIQDVTLDTYGHVTGLSSKTLTAADVGALSTSGKAADSNLLDGIDSSAFLRSNTSDTFTTLSGTQLNLGSQVQLRESSERADLLQITSLTSGLAGLQIRNSSNEGRWSFMTDGTTAGFYDDENNDWAVQMLENSEVRLYHNGSEKLNTLSGGVHVTGNITVSGSVDGRDVAADGSKLDGIAAGATANVGDITGVTAGSGITGGGTSGTVTINHADTSSQGSVNNSGATVIQDVTLDTYGHITGLGTATLSAATVGAASSTSASISTSISLTGAASAWQFALSGNNLIIKYGSTSLAKLDTSGNLTVVGDVTAFGTI